MIGDICSYCKKAKTAETEVEGKKICSVCGPITRARNIRRREPGKADSRLCNCCSKPKEDLSKARCDSCGNSSAKAQLSKQDSSKVYLINKIGDKDVLYCGITSNTLERRLQNHFNDSKSRNSTKDKFIQGITSPKEIEAIVLFEGNEEEVHLGEYYCFHLFNINNIENLNTGGPRLPSSLTSKRQEILDKITIEPTESLELREFKDLADQVARFIKSYIVDMEEVKSLTSSARSADDIAVKDMLLDILIKKLNIQGV